ncbi:MAG: hypothetical protein RIB84_13700 [Sneathiellaceae bacterium]
MRSGRLCRNRNLSGPSLKADGGFEITEFVDVVRKANTGLVEALDRYIRPRKQACRAVLLAH